MKKLQKLNGKKLNKQEQLLIKGGDAPDFRDDNQGEGADNGGAGSGSSNGGSQNEHPTCRFSEDCPANAPYCCNGVCMTFPCI